MNVSEWVARWWHHMPAEAQAEFHQMIMPHSHVVPEPSDQSESAVQADIRLAAGREFGSALYRNNSGGASMIDPKKPDAPPRHVRFGLGNDSARTNKHWKSSDLIGPTPVLIMPHHVGRRVGVFTAVEVKEPGWVFNPDKLDDRSQGQNVFMTAVRALGGLAGFAQSVDDYRRIIKGF